MIITIAKVQDKSNDKGTYIVLTDETGKDHHLFGHMIPDLASKAGILVEGFTVELVKKRSEKNPSWWDTVDVKQSTAKEAVTKEQSGDFAIYNLRQTSIERQNALTNAVNFWAGALQSGKVDIENALRNIYESTENFYNLVSKGIVPFIEEKPQETARVTSDDLFNALPAQTKEVSKDTVIKLCQKMKWQDINLNAYMKTQKEFKNKTLDDLSHEELVILIGKLTNYKP